MECHFGLGASCLILVGVAELVTAGFGNLKGSIIVLKEVAPPWPVACAEG